MNKNVLLLLLGLSLAVPALSAGVGDLYQPREKAGWVLEIGGKPIGEHVMLYVGPEEVAAGTVHRFVASTRLDAIGGAPPQKFSATLLLDDSGRPLNHILHADIGGSLARVELTFSAGKVDAVVVKGENEQKLTVDVPEGAWIQANNFIGYFEILYALNPFEAGETASFQLFSVTTVSSLPYDAEVVGSTEFGRKLQDSLGESIWMSDDGRLTRLEVPAAGLVVRRLDEPGEPFDLASAETDAPVKTEPESKPDTSESRFDSEEVEIVHGEVTLAGTITRPEGAEGKLPAVFFISGSGGQDRDGVSAGIDVGTHEILDRLTEAGFLVLRVDDRGVGGSRGPTVGMGFQDLVADARAAVDALFERDDVDPERVVLIGHSEGGLTAPILAGERKEIAAVVLMAAMGRPMIDVIMQQNEDALVAAGVTGESLETTLAEIRGHLERVASDEPLKPEELPAEFRTLLTMRTWLQEHSRENPLERIAALRCPVLVLQGERDFQVSAELDAQAIGTALKKAEHPDFQLEILPGLDHLFKVTVGESSTLADYRIERPVDEAFLDLLVGWLSERLID